MKYRPGEEGYDAFIHGICEERTRIVKWLRNEFRLNRNAKDFADLIERGEHVIIEEHRNGCGDPSCNGCK